MNLQDFRYFQKLAELKSYSNTAKYFNISQPTVTYAVKRLESEYNTQLTIKDTKSHTLTISETGNQLLVHIERILFEETLAHKEIRDIQNPKIKVGFPPIITNYFSNYFSYFKDINILSAIDPVTSESQVLMKQIINGDLDATLVGTANLLNDADLETKLLRTHKFKIVSSKNRVLSKTDSLSLTNIKNEYMIVLDENSVHNKILSSIYSSLNINPNILFKTPDYKLALDLISQDKGIGFFTETALSEPEKFNIYEIKEAKDINFYIYLVYRKDKILNKDLTKLINAFEKSDL